MSDKSDRCSEVARAAALDPIGTANAYRDYLLVEYPLPWPRDAADVPFVPEVRGGARVQLVVPADGVVGPARRVVRLARRPDGWFDGFRRTELVVAPEDVPDACARLLAGEGEPTDGIRDVLVCTHGRRDRCCGRLGPMALAGLGDVPDDVQLWRTSHTGGHRFAPTGITFPDGLYWAYLDDDVLGAVIERGRSTQVLARHVRGCAAFEAPAAQAVDRDALVRFGWEWPAVPRRAVVDGHRVELRYRTALGDGVITATVEMARKVPVPDCGLPLTGREKTQDVWRVTAFEVVEPAVG